MSKENEILHHIKINPYITQQELAQRVGLSRSAVANYIANLTRTGEIKGRAYVLKEDSTIVCIGAANTDRKAKSDHSVQLHSSNPVTMIDVCGGVARNFAENLSRLGYSTSLMSCVGNDREGEWILEETKRQGVDVSQVWMLDGQRTGAYTALLDVSGEMVVSMADMSIYDKITIEMLEEKWSFIAASQAVFLDTNIPKECIHYLIKRCKDENIPLYVNPVSKTKTEKLPHYLDGVEVLVLNQEEAEELVNFSIDNTEQSYKACQHLRERGVKNIIIILSDGGVTYASQHDLGNIPAFDIERMDETGADDAFAAGLIHGIMNEESLSKACLLGIASYAITQQTERSVSTELNLEKIEWFIEECIRE